ncbi:cell wall hydrolase [Sphingomonas japonica]
MVNAAAPAVVPTPPSPILPASLTPESSDIAAEPPIGAVANPALATSFASLSDAVDAHAVGAGTLDDETRCLAIGVYFESKGEPLSGQLAVANVILNRAGSGRFPSSVCGVLTQRSQFSFVRGGRLPSVPEGRAAWKTAVAVAKIAQADAWKNPAPNALFFHARHVSPRWNKARVASLGNHIFYR